MNSSSNAGQNVAALISSLVRKYVMHTESDNVQPYVDGDSLPFYLWLCTAGEWTIWDEMIGFVALLILLNSLF